MHHLLAKILCIDACYPLSSLSLYSALLPLSRGRKQQAAVAEGSVATDEAVQLSLWCLNPAVAFDEVASQAHSVVRAVFSRKGERRSCIST